VQQPLGETGGDWSPQLLGWVDQQCVGAPPPNFLAVVFKKQTNVCMSSSSKSLEHQTLFTTDHHGNCCWSAVIHYREKIWNRKKPQNPLRTAT